jgi:hypothetical protein
MSLEKIVTVDRVELVENNHVQVRTKTVVMENDKVIGKSFHRHVVAPGDDYSQEDARVKAICAATHTQDVISAYEAAQAAKGV